MALRRGNWLIVRGDGAEVLASLDDSSVGAVVTDPPWNRGQNYGTSDDSREEHAYVRWLRTVLVDSARVSRGPVAVFLGKENTDRLSRLARASGLGVLTVLQWQRSPGVEEGVAVIGGDERHQLPELLVDRARAALASAREPVETFGHPCPKPVSAVEALVQLVAPAHGVVLDPFMGVGTTLVAASRQGRPSIGIDIEPRFCQIAVQRLQELENRGDA
jgi:DNA modification methylase